MAEPSKNFLARARSWTTKHKLSGPHAFLRFVMMTFVEQLNETSDEFVFKGGNLLWMYIKTPRSTVDLDFVTKTFANHSDVRKALDDACNRAIEGIKYALIDFDPIENRGASARVSFKTDQGQENTFELDIVYKLLSVTQHIASPIRPEVKISAVTLENIISDKLAAAHQYGSGNSRMKDFDDLWRISVANSSEVSWGILAQILRERTVSPELQKKWINPLMEKSWQSHVSRNKDLPSKLHDVFASINSWLANGLSDQSP